MPSAVSDLPAPPLVELGWERQYRVISSAYPTIDFFETLVDPERMEALLYVEGLTNERLRDQVGDIALVAPEDRISGRGATPVMAAFTHIGVASRFSDGSYGLYYAARTLETAVAESRYHRARFLAYTDEDPGEIDMRVYVGKVLRPLHDLRGPAYASLHSPIDWGRAQVFGGRMKELRSWGLAYRSVRDPGGECIGALRPPTVSRPRQGAHLSFVWDGRTIVRVYRKTLLR